ncbi:chaperonin-containing T-complex member BBS12 [Thomomys bottae]
MAVACWAVDRRHKGLQQLASLAETGRTFLGPLKASKFVTDAEGGESVLVSSTIRLLESLDVSSAVGQLLNEAIHAQHGAHGTGTSTLLFLAGAWSRAVEECLQLGIPIPAIVEVMAEGLTLCTEEVALLQVPVHLTLDPRDSPRAMSGLEAARLSWNPSLPPETTVGQEDHHHQDVACHSASPFSPPGAPGTRPEPWVTRVAAGETTSFGRRRSVLSRSRHLGRMGGGRDQSKPGTWPGQVSDSPRAQACTDLAELAAGLSHGSDGCMALVEAAVRLQLRGSYGRPCVFDPSRLFTCCVPGLPDVSSSVCPGFVTLAPACSAAVIRALAQQPARVVLVEGDLTHTFRHPGFHGPGRVRTELGDLECGEEGSEAAWAEGVEQALRRLRVDLVLARGGVADALAERCLRAGRLALSSVPGRALQAISEASGAEPVFYVSQLHEGSVGSGVSVAPWPGPSDAALGRDWAAVAVVAEGAALVTAMLAGAVAGCTQSTEDDFWRCTRRVQGVLAEGKVFPGAGAVELRCVRHLLALAEGQHGARGDGAARPLGPQAGACPLLQAHRPAVLQGLAGGWRQYLAALLCNATGSSAIEANTVIQRHLQDTAAPGSPPAPVLRELSGGRGWLCSPRLPDEPEPAARVYDVVTPKVEAWRRALDLVLLVLQTDSEVITGHGHSRMSAQPSDGVLFL